MLRQREISTEQLGQLCDGGCVFAIVDACVDHEQVMHQAYNKIDASRAISLFKGTYMESYDAAAPYLFSVGRQMLEWIPANLNRSHWGVFVLTKAKREALVAHLQRFLMVVLPDGRKGYFRYYDPRILRAYLPTCQPGELQTFFGAVRGFATMDETGNMVFDLSDASPAEFAVHPSGLWPIRPEQMHALSGLSRDHFVNRVVAHLREFFPHLGELYETEQMRTFVLNGIQRATAFGMTTEFDTCRYICFLSALGSGFEQDPRYAWATETLRH